MSEIVVPWPVVGLVALLAILAVVFAVRLLFGRSGGGGERRADRR